jgi:hypothetical protein
MSIVADIGGIATYIAPMGSPRTIPAGVTNEQLVFQANDNAIGDNAGGVSFHVKICRPTAEPIFITYAAGSGPGAAGVGNNIIMTFVNEGPDNGLAFSFSRVVKIKVVGSSGWNFNPTASANRYIGGVNVQHYDLSATLPEAAGIEDCTDHMTWGCAPGGTTQIQLEIEAECP